MCLRVNVPGTRSDGGEAMLLMWANSHYSFLRAVTSPELLVEAAHRMGWRAMVLADVGGVYGMVKAHRRAQALGMRILVGCTLTREEGGDVLLIAQSVKGYAQMCALISQWHQAHQSWTGEQLASAPNSDLLCCLVGDGGALVEDIKCLAPAFGDRLYLAIQRQHMEGQQWQERRLLRLAHRFGVKPLASHHVRYHSPTARPVLDVLRCIERRCQLTQLIEREPPLDDHSMLSTTAFRRRFEDQPSWLDRLDEVARRVSFTLANLSYDYPKTFIPNGLRPEAWLRVLVHRGARTRYGSTLPDAVLEQLERELSLIEKLRYAGYFLTMWRIVQFCQRQGILCQGRGSAANSAVCYCLGLTAVDPVKMGLLFERFLSEERQEPPDIDLDIEHERREEVIQFVYSTFGRAHAAMVCTIVCFRTRAAIREVGKVFGLDDAPLGLLSKRVGHGGQLGDEDLQAVGWSTSDPMMIHYRRMVDTIRGIPRYISTHPGGFMLSANPIHHMVPTQPATMPDRTIIQWDKDDVDDMGIFKLDLLGLGALSCISRAFALLKQHHQRQMTLADIPPDDASTYQMIQRAETIGVFQIESRAQMSMLPRLKPKCFYDLVIEISLVRPGPVAGDMVHPYLRRRQGLESIHVHPLLAPVLMRTLGVPLFQEQVMRVAMLAAGYTPGQADQLRRDMASWQSPGKIERHRQQLIEGMLSRGFTEDFAHRIFRQIQGFGSYGFPESHAASFALLAYATAYLRCHEPAVFTCALLQSQPMGFYAPHSIIEDARRRAVPILPVCVKCSQWLSGLEKVPDTSSKGAWHFGLRLGLRWVNGLSKKQANDIIEARDATSLFSWLQKTPSLTLPIAQRLAQVGALACFGVSRREALWQVCTLWRARRDCLSMPPPSTPSWPELSQHERIEMDYAVMGLSPIGHRMMPYRQALQSLGLPTAKEVWSQAHSRPGQWLRFASVVVGRQRPSTASGTVFLTMEDETGMVNVIIHSHLYEQHRALIRTSAALGVAGILQYEQGVVHLLAKSFWVPEVLAHLSVRSRDFH